MKTNPGRFFENYTLGEVIRHAVPRTVGQGERALYHALYPARGALYSSDEFARGVGLAASPLDDLITFHTVFGKTVPDISLNAVANLGYGEGRWLRPVWPGDTLRSESEVIGLKETSSGATGVVWVRTRGLNQRDEVVLEYVRWVMVRKRRREVVVPVSVPADQLAVQEVDAAALLTFLRRMEFSTLTKRIAEALKVLDVVLPGVERTEYDLGARRYHATGETLPDGFVDELKGYDAILLGAIGDPSVPSGVLERGLLLKLRFALDHYVNLRPNKYYPGVPTPLANPGEIDFLVVREGTEGLYCGNGGVVREGTPHEIATEVSVNTAFGVERVVRYAFEKANSRPRKKLTYVHKHNVLVNAGHLWRRTVEALNAEYPEVSVDYLHVDAATIFLVTDPGRFDVMVTDNLFGDILTDEAGAVTGGVGLAASGNINPEGAFPSMFEPIHGSAPDIAGKQIADPIATIASVALLLDHLGFADEARKVEAAIDADMAARAEAAAAGTPLQRSTSEVGDAIAALLAK